MTIVKAALIAFVGIAIVGLVILGMVKLGHQKGAGEPGSPHANVHQAYGDFRSVPQSIFS